MVSESFRTRRRHSSPYIVEDAYPKIEKPVVVDETVWAGTTNYELTQAIWTKAQAHIAANEQLSNYVPSEEITNRNNRGHVAAIGSNLYQMKYGVGQRHPSLVAVEDAVIPETVDTIWSSVVPRSCRLGCSR